MNRLLYALYLASRWLATGSAYTRIAIAFDARKVDVTRIRDITVALATVASNPISVTPLVPTFGANTATTNLSDQIYFLLYPFPLPGDVLPTVQVTATYLAPFPGEPWQPRTVYPPGAIVTPATPDGHYYETVDGGVSQLTEPGTWTHFSSFTGDGNCIWQPIVGTPPPGTATAWASGAIRPVGTLIILFDYRSNLHRNGST